MQVEDYIVAIQHQAAMAGIGPPEWAVGAWCKAVLLPDSAVRNVIITKAISSGRFMVQILGQDEQALQTRQPSRALYAEVGHMLNVWLACPTLC